jgi:PAS domain S-box-containing protein
MISILHVDDDERELRLASKYLNRISDYLRIVQTTSGKEAMDIIRRMRFDCIVADYHMPEMNGMDLFHRLREANIDIPFILLTGKGNEKIAADAIKSGVNAYVIKEGDIYFYEEMLKTIRRIKTQSEQTAEREKAVRILAESENYLADVQRAARIGYSVFNISTGFWKSSALVDEILGIDEDYPKTLEGLMELIEPEYQKSFLYHFQHEALGNSGLFDYKFPVRRLSTNEQRWIHGQGKVSFDDNGNPINMIGTFRDITEQKGLLKKLETANKSLSTVMKLTEDAVFLVDHRGRIVDANEAALNLLGLNSLKEISDTKLKDALIEQEELKPGDLMEELFLRGSIRKTIEVRRSDDDSVPCQIKAEKISETCHIVVLSSTSE